MCGIVRKKGLCSCCGYFYNNKDKFLYLVVLLFWWVSVVDLLYWDCLYYIVKVKYDDEYLRSNIYYGIWGFCWEVWFEDLWELKLIVDNVVVK